MVRKKSEEPTSVDSSSTSGKQRSLTIISPSGSRYPFLRGMITHDLIRRGLDFDRAYATADALRDRLRDRGEISSEELSLHVSREVESLFGKDAVSNLSDAPEPPSQLWVVRQGTKQPFSRGVLARSILAAGVELESAYRVVIELHDQLVDEGTTVLPSHEIVRRITKLLRKIEGKGTAKRYRLVRQIPRLPRPLIVYLGGASGTGKSTLGFELAPLLRIYRMNSTDTVRQVMRMVFSPAILPSLHISSFESPETLPTASDDIVSPGSTAFDTSFAEQSQRVLVGVRAVVDRAIKENMSIVVEGVHLFPPLIPFSDLEGAAYQVPLVLGTVDPETHRSRFLTRARLGGRRAERYVENFETIRAIHDRILEEAEAHDVPMLDTSDPIPPVSRALRIIVRQLQREVPELSSDTYARQDERPPSLLVVIDGLADRPVRALGGRTPLQAAATPTLDQLALEGRTGLADPVAPGVVPDTAAGTLALLGQSPLALKRGPVEALGAGLTLSPEDIALRGNLATVDEEGNVIDRRAGRIRAETDLLAQALDRLPLPGGLADDFEIRVKAATEHRLAIVLRGKGLSSNIQGSDPGEGAIGPPLTPRPLDPSDSRAVRTARILALFERRAHAVLDNHPVNQRRLKEGEPAANSVLTRGAGRIHRLVPLEDSGFPLRLSCIAGDRTILGLASWLGAETHTAPEMTANLDTDLELKFSAAIRALTRTDLVVLHLKGADIAAHDQRSDLKVRYLEQVDQQLGRLVETHEGALRIAIASDHATLSESGQHGSDPLPVLLWERDGEGDSVERFDEQSVASGSLQRFPLQMFLGKLFNLG
jgi:2,3-bisphosphoglycerate-independent phosphoglycerate mutase